MNVKCAYIFGRFLCPIFISIAHPSQKDGVGYILRFRVECVWMNECVWNLHVGHQKRPRFSFVTEPFCGLKYFSEIYFDLTRTQRIYHFLEPIRYDSWRIIVQEIERDENIGEKSIRINVEVDIFI